MHNFKRPYSEWAKLLKQSYDYCNSLPLYRVFEFVGKCPSCKLESSHPYWSLQIARSKFRSYQLHSDNLRKCKQNYRLLPVLYNNTTDIDAIESRISTYLFLSKRYIESKQLFGERNIDRFLDYDFRWLWAAKVRAFTIHFYDRLCSMLSNTTSAINKHDNIQP